LAGVLEGIKIIETASAFAGPMAGRLLADWGADVIHVEHPARGDMSRSRRRGLQSGSSISADIDYGGENHNRNKRSMSLDISKEAGLKIIYEMLRQADVFLSNFRPRELAKFHLQYDDLNPLNPRLVSANMSAYGTKGPKRDLPGFEGTSYFSRSGMLHVLQAPGTAPCQIPNGLGDYVGGLALAYGIVGALFMREKTGAGQEVDVSLYQAGVFALSYDIAGALVTGQDRRPVERKDLANSLMNFYQTKDGRWVRFVIAQPDMYWARFCQALERKDIETDPRFADFDHRVDNHVALFHAVEEAILSRTLTEWTPRFDEAGLPWGAVQTLPEVISDSQARANDFFLSFEHPTHGTIEVVAGPAQLSKSPETVRLPAPEFGQHTEEILLEYGYTWENIAQFKEQHIIA